MSQPSHRRSNKLRRAESTRSVELAACRLFVERGYRSTSMEMIASEVGLTKGAVYFYYKDKETLLLKLLAQSEAHFFKQIFDSMDEKPNDPSEQIDVFLDQIIRAGIEIDQYLLLLPVLISTEFKNRGNSVEASVRAIYERVYDKLTLVIKNGQISGEFTNHLNARSLAAMIVALTDGLLLEIYRQISGVTGKNIAIAASASVNALLKGPATNSVK